MTCLTRFLSFSALAVSSLLLVTPAEVHGQAGDNPFRPVAWGFLPEGREWGPTSAVYPDRDGVHIWVAERCGPTGLVDNRGESCLNKDVDPILKFDADGNVVESFGAGEFLFSWGEIGHDWGEFMQPHALAMDSQGRLFVGDRSNNRIQIFDQMGTFLETWGQFSRPSGVYIDANDTIYVADSESSE